MLDYEKQESIQLQNNILSFRKSILNGLNKNQIEKINKFCLKFNLEYEYVSKRIITDDLFILHFIKEPNKQSFHQNFAFNYIKSIQGISNAKILPNNGDKAFYLVNGQIISGANLTSNSKVKSIDFFWNYTDSHGVINNCYATHKYTKENGGSQNNQFKDVETFFDDAAKYRYNVTNEPPAYFFAICDGDYYKQSFKGVTSRIEYLNQNYKTSANRIQALDINELELYLKTI